MNKSLLREGVMWGALLWLFGYALSFVFYPFVPVAWLGLAVGPFALVVTIWVAFKKVNGPSLSHYALVGVIWTVLAVVLDYFLLVRLLKPADGYYKIDVYLYYVLTFAVPTAVGWWKLRRKAAAA
jgi:hypothetical protein